MGKKFSVKGLVLQGGGKVVKMREGGNQRNSGMAGENGKGVIK